MRERFDALADGSVDASLLAPPLDEIGRGRGMTAAMRIATAGPGVPGLGVVARRSLAGDSTSTRRSAYLRALDDANRWMREAPPGEVEQELRAAGFGAAAVASVARHRPRDALLPSAEGPPRCWRGSDSELGMAVPGAPDVADLVDLRALAGRRARARPLTCPDHQETPCPKPFSSPPPARPSAARSRVRSPSMRPDDLAVQMLQAALAQVPELDPRDIDDLVLGCAQPGGEAGFNMARVVAVLAGMDHLPGTTVNRYCASSLQAVRMAFHAIRAGEGDAFVAAGVEAVSRFGKGNAGRLSPTPRTPRSPQRSSGPRGCRRATCPGPTRGAAGELPDMYLAMGETAENVAELEGISRQEQDDFAVRSQNRAEKALADGFWERDITPVTLADGTVVSRDDSPRAGVTLEAVAAAEAGVPPERHGDRGQRLPAQRRRGSAS